MKDSNKAFQKMREEYLAPEMSEEQVRKMRMEMDRARQKNRRSRRRAGQRAIRGFGAAAAVLVLTFVILPNTSMGAAHAMEKIPLLGRLVEVVTFREYSYEDDRNSAQIEVPELALAGQESGEAASQEVTENLKKSTEEINAEIQRIADTFVEEFEKNLGYTEGYQNMLVKSEVICTTEDYFTLKLICYQGAGSGTEWNYFYTIDLNTGKRLELADLFQEGADYITPISEDIKTQMREQMAADDMKTYWLDNEDIPEWNFQAIMDETSFYLNREGRLVIAFSEGDVAPMYMGCVEFVISEEALEGLWKNAG